MEHIKVWGTTERLIETPFFQLHRIKFKKGGVCSTHHHEFRRNLFYVVEGVLLIWTPFGEPELKAGDMFTVRANMRHYFEALTDGIALEIYYPEKLSDSDIIRENVGHMRAVK